MNIDEVDIMEYMPIVYSVANRLQISDAYNLEFEDYVNIGVIGLINGIKRYEERTGYTFRDYLFSMVRYEIIHFLQKECPLSRYYVKFKKKLYDFEQTYMHEHDIYPTDFEIADALDMDVDLVRTYKYRIKNNVNMSADDTYVKLGDDGSSLIGCLTNHSSMDYRTYYDNIKMYGEIKECFDVLTEYQQMVINEYFFENKTLHEMEREHGIHKSSLGRTKERAINRIREEMHRRNRINRPFIEYFDNANYEAYCIKDYDVKTGKSKTRNSWFATKVFPSFASGY